MTLGTREREVIERTPWKLCSRRDYEHVARQTTWWWW